MRSVARHGVLKSAPEVCLCWELSFDVHMSKASSQNPEWHEMWELLFLKGLLLHGNPMGPRQTLLLSGSKLSSSLPELSTISTKLHPHILCVCSLSIPHFSKLAESQSSKGHLSTFIILKFQYLLPSKH